MTRPAEERRILEKVAERQVRRWALDGEISRRLAEEKARPPLVELVRPYVAISREAGTGGGEIARQVAERLGWDVLGKELLDFMAERYDLPRGMLEMVDETTANWFLELFGKWLDQSSVTQAEYVTHMSKLVLLAAQHGSTVFVGRGAQFLLPPDRGVAVRLVAARDSRVERLARVRGLDAGEAERRLDEIDRGRDQFVRRYFDRDPADPHLYDLVIQLDRVQRADAVDLIVDLHRRRLAKG